MSEISEVHRMMRDAFVHHEKAERERERSHLLATMAATIAAGLLSDPTISFKYRARVPEDAVAGARKILELIEGPAPVPDSVIIRNQALRLIRENCAKALAGEYSNLHGVVKVMHDIAEGAMSDDTAPIPERKR